MEMQRSNFIAALAIAIRETEKAEQTLGYKRPSSFLVGMREVFAAAIEGDWIQIVGKPA